MLLETSPDRLLPIAGRWQATGAWTEVRSPYDGRLVGRVARAGREHAERAIEAAAAAMRTPLPAHRRAAILDHVAAGLDERREELAGVLSLEAGKPHKLALVEVERAAWTFRTAAAEARTLVGRMVPMDATAPGTGRLAFTVRAPVGVVGAITPFNFPLNLAAHKVAPAVAAGCAVVLKPATATPLTTVMLAEALEAAGLPAGWVSVLVGPAAAIGDALVEDERVRLITFTGSSDVGWSLRARAPRKRVALELGNSTPVIVEPDADLDDAAAKIALGAFGFAGQSCISVQRIYVHRDVADDLAARVVARAEALVVGDPADPRTDVGPLIDAEARDRVAAWVREAVAQGATLLTGSVEGDGPIAPVVLADVTPAMKVCCREVFGPVCTLTPYASLDEAVALANGTEFGLQAGIFTGSLDAALWATPALEFGGVTVNEAPTYRADQMPYGGIKVSGNTKEGPAWTVREMTEERLLLLSPSARA